MYQQANPNEMPGIGTTQVAAYKPIWKGRGGVQYLPGGGTIDGANARDPANTYSGNLPNAQASYVNVLEPGLLLGKITASGFYGAAVYGLTGTAITGSSSTSFRVSKAVGVELIRRLGGVTGSITLRGPATTGGTVASESATVTNIAAYDSTHHTVTLYAAPTNSYVVGSLVQPADGSQTVKTFVDEEDGIRVDDINGSSLTIQFPRVPISGGVVYAANIVNYSAADSAVQSYIKTALKAVGNFLFDDDL